VLYHEACTGAEWEFEISVLEISDFQAAPFSFGERTDMTEQLTVLTGLMILFLGFLGGAFVDYLYHREKIREINKKIDKDHEAVLAHWKGKHADLDNLLNGRLQEQKKLYIQKKETANIDASTIIKLLKQAIQISKDLRRGL